MAKPTIVEGQTATNPQTGAKIVYQKGRWYPAASGGAAAPRAPGGGRLTPQEEIQLKEARDAAEGASDFARQADDFVKLNRKSGTGFINKIPFVSEARAIFDPNVAQMDALSARMIPAQRTPGSGTTSDRDLALYSKAVPSLDRPGEANAAIARDMGTTAQRRAQRAAFLDQYAQDNGTLRGADAAWRSSQQKAPNIFAPKAAASAQAGNGWKVVKVH